MVQRPGKKNHFALEIVRMDLFAHFVCSVWALVKQKLTLYAIYWFDDIFKEILPHPCSTVCHSLAFQIFNYFNEKCVFCLMFVTIQRNNYFLFIFTTFPTQFCSMNHAGNNLHNYTINIPINTFIYAKEFFFLDAQKWPNYFL